MLPGRAENLWRRSVFLYVSGSEAETASSAACLPESFGMKKSGKRTCTKNCTFLFVGLDNRGVEW